MTAYEFYWFNPLKGYELLGVLPERRKNPERITQESISNFARTILGNEADVDDLFFIEITLNESTGQILWPEPSIRLTQTQA